MTKAAVIGWPISHSKSPLIHGYWIEQYKLSASYEKIAVKPEDLEQFLARIQGGEFAGCNVTIPHKETAFQLVNVQDPLTHKLKSVNTIYIEHDQLMGLSTDGLGFLLHLKSQHPTWSSEDRTIAVYGAGGAARSIIAQLLYDGATTILLTNRTLARAERIAEDFGRAVRVYASDEFEASLVHADLLINTTALGMAGQPELALDISRLAAKAIVADIVYSPLRTDLLRQAEQRGHLTLDGLGMLLHQAVPGFERWFGVRPTVTTELYDLIARDIESAR